MGSFFEKDNEEKKFSLDIDISDEDSSSSDNSVVRWSMLTEQEA
jgi:hypothetical protein